MIEFRPARRADLPAVATVWGAAARALPHNLTITRDDLERRVFGQQRFDISMVLLAARGEDITGFVHYGPRLSLWEGDDASGAEEGQLRVIAVPEGEQGLVRDLIGQTEERLAAAGARRVLIGPSWVQGGQPCWNCVAGAYELPGLSATGQVSLEAARELGYTQLTEYGTPELDLSDPDTLTRLTVRASNAWTAVREVGLQVRSRRLQSPFFSPRVVVELTRGNGVVATAAYGPWPEYERRHHRRLFGFTNVQVVPNWRGRGLGTLVMLEALRAAQRAGAELAQLHVWRENAPAWNLYHRTLGFQPRYSWVTLAKDLTAVS